MVDLQIIDLPEFTFGLAGLAEASGDVNLANDLREIGHGILEEEGSSKLNPFHVSGGKSGERDHSRNDGRLDGVRGQ